MPKRTDIKKVMVIGSGPIVIGQAAEFDYAGTQACLALKEEGYEVILVNSNPATIMTDTFIADKVYMEPLKLEYVAKIIRYERPDAIVPGLGGQTGLNLAVQLAKKGILDECQVEILGTSFQSIEQAEDRELFKELCVRIGEPVIPSRITNSIEEGVEAAKAYCRNTRGPIASIYYQGLMRYDQGLEAVEKAVVSYGSVQQGQMESGLSWISLFIALSPSLGFMGTVVGMIQAFDDIQAQATISPAVVAGGIKVALLTTMLGLIAAVILQIFFNYILAQIEAQVVKMEDSSIQLIDMLSAYNKR